MSKTVRRPTSGTQSGYGGKWYFDAVATFGTSAITITPRIHITDACDNKHTFSCQHGKAKHSGSFRKKGTHTLKAFTVKAHQNKKITFKYGTHTATITAGTIVNTSGAPLGLSTITASLNASGASINVTVKGTQGTSVPTNRIEVEQCVGVKDINNFTPITSSPFSITSNTGAKINKTYTAQTDITRGNEYWFRARAGYTASGKYSGWVYSSAVYTKPNNDDIDTSSMHAVRVSDNKVTLSWAVTSLEILLTGTVKAFRIYRSTNGGTPVPVAEVKVENNRQNYSFTDNTTAADNVYNYSLAVVRGTATAEDRLEFSDTIKMRPAKPQSISVWVDENGYANVDIEDVSGSADYICIERKLVTESVWTETQVQLPATSWVDPTVLTDVAVEYRARNFCDDANLPDKYSEYLDKTDGVSTDTRQVPNPPTLNRPVNQTIATEDAVLLEWTVNSLDGSLQTEATVRYMIDDGEWNEDTTEYEYYELDLSQITPNSVISWQVKTKCAKQTGGTTSDGYSDWSELSMFAVMKKPTIELTSPVSPAESLPITVAWTYTDLSGILEELTLSIFKDRTLVKTVPLPTDVSSYVLGDFLFENYTQYALSVAAKSSTGLYAYADMDLAINYEPASIEGGLVPVASFDDDGIGWVSIERDQFDDEGEEVEPAEILSAFLYRLHDGERTLVAEVEEGDTVEDKYAPINADFTYELLQMTETEVAIESVTTSQDSNEWFIYFGDEIARARWNPDAQIKLSKPEKNQVHYSGRKYPVSYDSTAIGEDYSFNFVLDSRDEVAQLRRMMSAGGQGVWKSGTGEVYDADFDFSYSPNFENKTYECQLSITRIEADDVER